jgi:hypothetical protein
MTMRELVVTPHGVGREADIVAGARGAEGYATIRLEDATAVQIEVGEQVLLRVRREGGRTQVSLGDSADHRVVLGEALVGFLTELVEARFNAHVHQTAQGPTSPPDPAFRATPPDEAVMLSRQVRVGW